MNPKETQIWWDQVIKMSAASMTKWVWEILQYIPSLMFYCDDFYFRVDQYIWNHHQMDFL